MLPAAPGRLSMTTGCPNDSASRCPTSRARMSVVPPAGNGTTSRIGLLGYGWASAPAAVIASTTNSAAHCRIRVIVCSISASLPTAVKSVHLGAGFFDDPCVLGDFTLDQRCELFGRCRRGLRALLGE